MAARPRPITSHLIQRTIRKQEILLSGNLQTNVLWRMAGGHSVWITEE